MKKLIILALTLILLVSFTACANGNTTSNPPSSEAVSDTPSSDMSSEDENGRGDIVGDESGMITGTLYAVLGSRAVKTREFGYQEGSLTPEDIARELTAWTGLKFEISAKVGVDNNIMIIDWKSNSSLATGESSIPQGGEFYFHDADSLRWFMLNSLCRSIRENMGDYDVFYSIEGGDLNVLELGVDFDPYIAYNRHDDGNIMVN